MSECVVDGFSQELFRVLWSRAPAFGYAHPDLDVSKQIREAFFHQRQDIVRKILLIARDFLGDIHITMDLGAEAKTVCRMLATDQHAQGGDCSLLKEVFPFKER